jgi:hypothetical protein
MASSATSLNEKYLLELFNAKKDGVLKKVKELWWESFVEHFKENPNDATNTLDRFMDGARARLDKMAKEYAKKKGFKPGTPRFTQRATQFLKSNTGKMFERFVGLAIAYYLKEKNSNYCILPFKTKNLKHCHNAKRNWFNVSVKLGTKELSSPIDADLFAFDPKNENNPIYLISIKSTLKDRFHNVPFWNLLRIVAVNGAMKNVVATKKIFLEKLRYIAICSDLAKEQPDFSDEGGPRNLIALDAALLDGAYVTASRAKGLGKDPNHQGFNREHAFYPLSTFCESLVS